MHIGLIGGIGPAATVAYYKRLVSKFDAAGIPLDLTVAHADISELSRNAKNDDRCKQAEAFARHVQQLKGAGCDIATITAITGHFCFEETATLSALPLLSVTELIDSFCQAHEIEVLGLLGSLPVLASHMFGLLRYPEIVVPDDDLEGMGRAYMDMALSGQCGEAERKRFIEAGAALAEKQNADAVLLAGTDLGLAFDGQDVGYRVVDALEIHTDGLLSMAGGQ